MEVMTAARSCVAIDVMARRREHPLPAPLLASVGVLATQRVWEGHPAKPFSEIFLVLGLHTLEMVRQVLSGGRGERRIPVLVALAGANEDLVTGEIEILHSSTGRVTHESVIGG